MKKKLSVIVLFILVILPFLAAQQVSEKKDIAVFKLSYYHWNIPNTVLGGIDEEIKGVFVNIGRFNVLGMTQRLEPGDLNEFIDKVKQFKEEKVEISEEVQMGQDFFTKADFDRLVGSFIVVVPSVASYVLEPKEGEFKANLKTSFNFINVEQGRTFAQAFVETQGSDPNPDSAAKAALDGIAMRLTFEIRKIPEFQLKTGVLEVHGSELILELGRDMGITVGDEFLIVSTRVLDSGKTYTTENGLLVIKEVSDEVSVGKIIYARPRPEVGDQLRELARLGLDTTPYLHVASALLQHDRTSPITVLAGLRQSISRGFFNFRPFAGIEVPFIANILAAIPLNLYVGGEYDLYLGRLQLVPMAALGVGGAYLWYLKDVPDEDKFAFTHVGGMANVSLTYLFNKNFRFVLEGGYLHWFSLVPLKYFFQGDYLFQDYDGLFAGAGITIKY